MYLAWHRTTNKADCSVCNWSDDVTTYVVSWDVNTSSALAIENTDEIFLGTSTYGTSVLTVEPHLSNSV